MRSGVTAPDGLNCLLGASLTAGGGGARPERSGVLDGSVLEGMSVALSGYSERTRRGIASMVVGCQGRATACFYCLHTLLAGFHAKGTSCDFMDG